MNDFQKIMQRQNKTAIEVMNIAAHELAVENMSPEDYETWEQGEKLRDAELARITAERDELYKLVEHLKEMNDDALMNGGGAWSRGGATDQRVNAALKQSS